MVGAGIDREADANGRRLAESLVKRLRAVLPGAHRDRVSIEQRRHVMRVDARKVEGDDAATLLRRQRSMEPELRHLAGQEVEGVLGERMFVGPNVVHANVLEVLERGTEADGGS